MYERANKGQDTLEAENGRLRAIYFLNNHRIHPASEKKKTQKRENGNSQRAESPLSPPIYTSKNATSSLSSPRAHVARIQFPVRQNPVRGRVVILKLQYAQVGGTVLQRKGVWCGRGGQTARRSAAKQKTR